MKILFSITYFDPYVSGLTIYVSRLSRALAKRGHAVSALCMQNDPVLPRRETRAGVAIHRAKTIGSLHKGFLSWEWIVLSWNLVKTHDIVIVNLPQFEGIIPALFGWLLKKKIIAIYHCEIVLSHTFIDQIIQSLVEISNMCTLLLSDTVVTYTDDFAKHSKLLRWVKQKVHVVYPPITPPTVYQTVRKRLKNQIGKADIIIGIAARLAREKGIEYVLEALPLINAKRNVAIVIAGPMQPVGEKGYQQKILHMVEQCKDHVVFLGSLSQKEIGAFYSLLDVLVLPSINSTEAFGMVQVEAMYCGVPVVASNLPGVRVPVQKTGMGVIVPIKNSHKLAEAIVQIINNKEHYKKPKTIIDKEFSFEKSIGFFERIL